MLTLASYGKSDYHVLVDETIASVSESYAAGELISFLQQSSSALMVKYRYCPQQITADITGRKLIVIGKNAVTAVLGLDEKINALGDEGFLIKAVGNLVIIAGGRLRGTLYGVYEFLEQFVGCRWYTPEVSNIPKRSVIEIPCDVDIAKTPAFAIREAFNMEIRAPLWTPCATRCAPRSPPTR
jgi:hypothetical protein